MSEFARLDGEKWKTYFMRIGSQHKIYGWAKLSQVFNIMSGKMKLDESCWRKWYQKEIYGESYKASRFMPDTIDFVMEDIPDDPYETIADLRQNIKELEFIRNEAEEIKKERMKLAEEKKEIARWLRELSRDELIMERICEAVKECVPIKFPKKLVSKSSNDKSYLLLFSDAHYGCEFRIDGLFGDIINSYSPEEFEKRMELLLIKTVEYVKKNNIEVLNVWELGDQLDGMIRVSQIWKLRYGIVESAVKYAEYISNWLNELSKYVHVRYQMTDGNHTELRQLGQPKGTFTKDNMGIIIRAFIKSVLDGNPNFTFVENSSGYAYSILSCNAVLGVHGEVKNIDNAISEFSNAYETRLDYLLMGHVHHSSSSEIGVRREVITVPSIVGIDDYSMKLKKTSNAGAKILTFDKIDGLINDYRIKLN